MGKGHTKACYILILLLTLPGLCKSQHSDSEVLYDLRWDWLFLNSDQKIYSQDSQGLDPSSVVFFVSERHGLENTLLLKLPRGTTLMVDDLILDHYHQDTLVWLSIQDLMQSEYSRPKLVTIFNSERSLNNIETQVVGSSPANTEQSSLTSLPRTSTPALVISLLVVLYLVALLRNLYPRSFVEYISYSRALAISKRDELVYKLRVFEKPNLLMQLLTGAAIAAFGIFVAITYPKILQDWLVPTVSLWQTLLMFVISVVVVVVFIGLKWIWIRAHAVLFKLTDFTTIHFVNGIRLSLLITITALAIAGIFYFVLEVQGHYYFYLLLGFLVLVIARLTILLFKLLSFSSYKFLHLFLYLCGTEIIPLLIAFRVVVKVV